MRPRLGPILPTIFGVFPIKKQSKEQDQLPVPNITIFEYLSARKPLLQHETLFKKCENENITSTQLQKVSSLPY